jgi:hypothetical protein
VSRVLYPELPGDALAAGLAGAACSAIPSTVLSLVRGENMLEGARAAGAMVAPNEQRTPALLVIAAPVHLAISLGWATVMAVALPRGGEPARGVAAGMAIATLDLALIGRRIPSIAALPQGRQWADHAAYGLAVGMVLRKRRSGRADDVLVTASGRIRPLRRACASRARRAARAWRVPGARPAG